MVAIIGAGLTGLSVAYNLKKKPYMIFEQEQTAGGLCRSKKMDGFTFDYTGHLLHLKNAAINRFANNLLPGKLVKIVRNAAVYYKGKYLPYPFQANLYGLPREVVLECVMSFVEAYSKKQGNTGNENFKDWAVETFGKGIANHFFIPYNEKLWQRDLRKLTSDWASWSIPRPTLREVIQGALGMENTGMGYNASFYYPRQRGIQILPDALCTRVKKIQYNKRLVLINLSKKRLLFHDGEETSYDTLVSTLPLPRLVSLIEDIPLTYKKTGQKLSYVSVQNLNIGINREKVSDFHWIYFPESTFPFYRVGLYSNFTPCMAPCKTSSLYIEIAALPGNKKSYSTIMDESREGLKQCGILKRGDRVVVSDYADIDCAYVVFDTFQRNSVPGVLEYLKKYGVVSAGRYGQWTYSSMEDAIILGRDIARTLT